MAPSIAVVSTITEVYKAILDGVHDNYHPCLPIAPIQAFNTMQGRVHQCTDIIANHHHFYFEL